MKKRSAIILAAIIAVVLAAIIIPICIVVPQKSRQNKSTEEKLYDIQDSSMKIITTRNEVSITVNPDQHNNKLCSDEGERDRLTIDGGNSIMNNFYISSNAAVTEIRNITLNISSFSSAITIFGEESKLILFNCKINMGSNGYEAIKFTSLNNTLEVKGSVEITQSNGNYDLVSADALDVVGSGTLKLTAGSHYTTNPKYALHCEKLNIDMKGGSLYVCGGQGQTGSSSGATGYTGGCAISVFEMYVKNVNRLIVKGGKGGTGATGYTGSQGPSKSENYLPGVRGTNGNHGTSGGAGGDGGCGATPIDMTKIISITIKSGSVSFVSGAGGDGGVGGVGGKGGTGTNVSGWKSVGGDGGVGGSGGSGGNARRGLAAINGDKMNISDSAEVEFVHGENGTPGLGGAGGAGGDPGRYTGGPINFGLYGSDGQYGANGNQGSQGGYIQ